MTSGNLMRSQGSLALLAQPVLLRPGSAPAAQPPALPPAGQWISDAALEDLKRLWMEDGRKRGREEALREAKDGITKAAEAAASVKLDQALKTHQEAAIKEQSEKWRNLAQALAAQMQGLREELRAEVSEWTMLACTRLLGMQVQAAVPGVIQHVLEEAQLDGALKVLLHPTDLDAVLAAREASPEAWPAELSFAASDRVPLHPEPINPLHRAPVVDLLETGIRAIDGLLPLGRGQRMGIFAGSGVGKSSLLGMLARNLSTDVAVIALIGERGREVQDFIQKRLSAEARSRTVIVVATAEQPAVVRARAAYTATSIAEYFRDKGQDVLLLMDSVTRFAMARREIDLAAGQPPTSRGYTPSVLTAIPALCERCGRLQAGGSITALYTVLVEGDDFNEPISDALRATLDGHLMLSRDLANEGHFPAIDVLHSVSRLDGDLLPAEARARAQALRGLLAVHRRQHDMVDMGLYRSGSNPQLDLALHNWERITTFLRQDHADHASIAQTQQLLTHAVASGASS